MQSKRKALIHNGSYTRKAFIHWVLSVLQVLLLLRVYHPTLVLCNGRSASARPVVPPVKRTFPKWNFLPVADRF